MNTASLFAKRGLGPVERRLEDRWVPQAARVGQFSLGMAIVAVGSLLLHATLVATALYDVRPDVSVAPEAVAVEIIQEKPAPRPLPVPDKANLERAEPAKIEPPKPALRTEPAPPRELSPTPKPALAETKRAETKAAEDKVAALEKEFEALKAERAALEAEKAAAQSSAAESAANKAAAKGETSKNDVSKNDASKDAASAAARPIDAGMGPLPDSFRAVALPAAHDAAGEAVDYRELVFSGLAKAKGLSGREGLPGTAGVHFTIDDTGHLAGVEIVHPSGIPSLDEEALAIVRQAAPFPPPPQGAQRSFDANVNFVVQSQR